MTLFSLMCRQGKFLRERDHAVKERDEAIKKFERMSEGCLQITKDITNTVNKDFIHVFLHGCTSTS
jgi:Fe-S cluster assembly ATPase SufC